MDTPVQEYHQYEKEVLTRYLDSAIAEVITVCRKKGLPYGREIRNLDVEIDAKYDLPIDNQSISINLDIDPAHFKLFKQFNDAVKKTFSKPQKEVQRLAHLEWVAKTDVIKAPAVTDTNFPDGPFKVSVGRGRQIRVTVLYPSGLALLYNLKHYIDDYLVEKEFADITVSVPREKKAVGPYSRMVTNQAATQPNELPLALGELLDAVIARLEEKLTRELKDRQQEAGNAKAVAPFEIFAKVPLNITDWRDQTIFARHLNELVFNKLQNNKSRIHFAVKYPPVGRNLCFIGPQLETTIHYPVGLKLLKELRTYIGKFPQETTPETFPLLHQPVRPPRDKLELMNDLFDSTQEALKDLHTKYRSVEPGPIAEALSGEEDSYPKKPCLKQTREYAKAVLKYESPVTATIFAEILKSLTHGRTVEERRHIYVILYKFFHPHSLEIYADEQVAKEATQDLCISAMKRIGEIGISQERTTAGTANAITLTHVKNGSLQSMAQLLSVMFEDTTFRKQWVSRYADRIFKADRMRENLGFAQDALEQQGATTASAAYR